MAWFARGARGCTVRARSLLVTFEAYPRLTVHLQAATALAKVCVGSVLEVTLEFPRSLRAHRVGGGSDVAHEGAYFRLDGIDIVAVSYISIDVKLALGAHILRTGGVGTHV